MRLSHRDVHTRHHVKGEYPLVLNAILDPQRSLNDLSACIWQARSQPLALDLRSDSAMKSSGESLGTDVTMPVPLFMRMVSMGSA